jgi:hypothetical protein
MGVATSEETIHAVFKQSNGKINPGLLETIEKALGLPKGVLSHERDVVKTVDALAATAPMDPWIRGEGVFREFVRRQNDLEAELRMLLIAAGCSDLPTEQLLTVLELVEQFCGTVHCVRPLRAVAPIVNEFHEMARIAWVRHHWTALSAPVSMARLQAAWGAMSHNDCLPTHGCVWSKESLTDGEARCASIILMDSASLVPNRRGNCPARR